MTRFGTRHVLFGLLAAALGGTTLVAAACGSGDDLGDIKATATAAAKNAPSPTATPDPVPAYRQAADQKAGELATAVKKIQDDMIAASTTQADPKWPSVLTADADAITQKANELIALKAPNADYQPVADQMTTAATKLSTGADLMKQAVTKLSQDFGIQGAAALDEGMKQLATARETLANKK
ncbi:MAG: hypothetical protein LC118_06575 [Dehalococcoidia bacterium]|nr:hypothetical protein [Dehalococcoidia bacterium]